MSNKHSWHHGLLMTTAVGISLVTAYSLVNPKLGHRNAALLNFPEAIPLSSWQPVSNKAIAVESPETEEQNEQHEIQGGNRYFYQDAETNLEIAMYYLTDTTGNTAKLLQQYEKISPETIENQQIKETKDGYYSLFEDSDRSYITGCLHSVGLTSVTNRQFSHSMAQKNISLQLLLNSLAGKEKIGKQHFVLLRDWLLGEDTIRDRRCLWITVSTPNHKGGSLFEPSEILLPVWHSWVSWWQPRFPSL